MRLEARGTYPGRYGVSLVAGKGVGIRGRSGQPDLVRGYPQALLASCVAEDVDERLEAAPSCCAVRARPPSEVEIPPHEVYPAVYWVVSILPQTRPARQRPRTRSPTASDPAGLDQPPENQ